MHQESIAITLGKAIHRAPMMEMNEGAVYGRDKLWRKWIDEREVIVMAVVGRYAMVRRPRCGPYVCLVRELVPRTA